MTKPRIIVIGAGFAGLSAAEYLARNAPFADVTVIDKYESTHFRPLIPDVISRTVRSRTLLYPILLLKDRLGFTFMCEPVVGIDFDARTVEMLEHRAHYDYLIIAAGSQTAYPPGEQFRRHALRFDTVHDANRARDAVESGEYDRFVVCGGGYTGVELASHLRKRVCAKGMRQEVVVVEMTDSLIGSLPRWMRDYAQRNLERMGVDIRLGARVEDISETAVMLSTGEKIEGALCIWTTGLIGPTLTRNIELPSSKPGRINVDEYLRSRECCFAAGDVACVQGGAGCARMAVQFAIDQGALAARNVIASLQGRPLRRFEAHDPGFIVPMANGQSCGVVSGIRMRGRIPTLLHYAAGAYRSRGMVNRLGAALGFFRSLSG